MTALRSSTGPRNDGHTRRYEGMIRKKFRVGIVTGAEFMVECCYHQNSGSPAMQINADTCYFVCFSCGVKGGPKTLGRHFGERLDQIEIGVKDMLARLASLEDQAGKEQQLPAMDPATLNQYSMDVSYWLGRGYTDATIKAFDLGYDFMSGKPTIALRNHEGDLIGFVKRDMDTDTRSKYKYPKGFKRGIEMFGSWMAASVRDDLVVICEGPTDAIKIWQAGIPAVAQYGSSLSAEQVKLIRRMGFGQVVLYYDNDKAGHKATANALGTKIHTHGGKEVEEYVPELDLRRDFLVSKVMYRQGMVSDPGGTSDAQIRLAIRKAIRVR